jgi:FAD/FMN-containing dehydrogenase
MTARAPGQAPESRAAFVDALTRALGLDVVSTAPDVIQGFLKDNSWLSPILAEYFGRGQAAGGDLPGVDVVASPRDLAQLREAIALAVRHEVPITPRGAGTSNFGGSIPLSGGMLLDLTRLNRLQAIADDRVSAEAGALVGDLERAARERGRDMTLLTTTYGTATIGGWVAGGHVGIGTSAYGTIWDGNVLAVTLLTAEDPPRELRLAGADLFPALHTEGTTGILTEVTVPLVPAREWLEAVASFDTFEAAAEYTVALSHEAAAAQRVVAAEEAPMPRGFTPLRQYFAEGQSGVLLIVDQAAAARFEGLAREHGGAWHVWKPPGDTRRLSLTFMVYGHRMLWNKRIAADAAFLHAYFAPGEELAQLAKLRERFGARVWRELKYMNSPYLRALRGLPPEGLLPAGVLALVPGERAFVDAVMAYCDAIGVSYLNPHTFVLEESGLFGDFAPILAFKRQTDPKGLLNPGKIGERFYAPSGRGVGGHPQEPLPR